MAIKATKFIWMDGKLVKWEDAKIHILTHALHYGSAVFDGIHSYKTGKGTAVFRLNEHINRLFYSAGSMGLKPAFTKEQLKNAIIETLKANKLDDAYIRPLIYYGYGNVGVFPKDIPTNIAIITVPWGSYYSKNLRVMTSKYIRNAPESTVFGTKISGNYANSILAMHEARKNGYDEALMLDKNGFISEGPVQNLLLVVKGSLISPESKSALHGITKDSIMKISQDLRIKTHEKKVTLKDVKNADELFFCGTASEITPIVSVDDKVIGNGEAGKITLRIKDMFFNVVRGKASTYNKWITYID